MDHKLKLALENLKKVHEMILNLTQSEGGKILSSHICYHKAEDQCNCRKPKTGLFQETFFQHSQFDKSRSWMVGDGITDIQAGLSYGLKTVFLGPKKCEICKVMDENQLNPTLWFENILDFSNFLSPLRENLK